MDILRESTPKQSGNLFTRAAHLCYEKLLKPTKNDETPADTERRKLILNIILFGLIIIFFGLDCLILFDSFLSKDGVFDDGVPFTYFSAIISLTIFLFFLSKKGRVNLVSYLLIVSSIIGASYGSYHWGISMPAGLLLYGFIISTASILISSEFGLLLTGVIVCFLISEGIIESTYHIVPIWRSQQMRATDGIQYSLLLLLTMTLSWISNREINKSLKRAIESEAELKTERDSLEIKVQERTCELRRAQIEKTEQTQRFAEFGRLSSGIFHDLMNSLSSVSLSIHSLEKNPVVIEEMRDSKECLIKAVALSKKMSDYLQNIKKQIHSDGEEETFSVIKEIEDCIGILSYRCKETRTEIVLQNETDFQLYGNPHKFYQIISNLLSNAIDACIGLEPERKKIFVKIKKEENRLAISIKDYGSGMRPDILKKIFNPFFSTKKDGAGMGLGLALIKENIESCFNGKIIVASQIDKGTTFKILVPIQKRHSKNIQNQSKQPD